MMQMKSSYNAITQSYNQKDSWGQNIMSVKPVSADADAYTFIDGSANVMGQSQTAAKSSEASTVAITASASNGAVRIAAPNR